LPIGTDDWTPFTVHYTAHGVGATGRFAIAYVGAGDTSNYLGIDTFAVTAAIPEPEAWALLLAGLASVGVAARRRKTPRRSSHCGAALGRAVARRAFVLRRHDMFAFLKPLGLGAVLASAVVVPSLAFGGPDKVTDAAPPTAATSGGDARIVVRDAATGQLRAPTAEEAQALLSHARSLRRASGPATLESRTHWSGARGARLTDDFATYTVVVKSADGSLVELCIEGGEATAKVLKAAPVAKSQTLPTE
jgi:hypothetical protein